MSHLSFRNRRLLGTALAFSLLAGAYLAGGAEPYPSLYRGVPEGGGVRIRAHFSPAFLSLSAADQRQTFDELSASFESLHRRKENDPRIEEPLTIDALVVDRPNDIFYVVNGTRFYPVRARGLHLSKRSERCGDRLAVDIDAEWVTDSPPLESAPAPPSEPDPDGLLIFKGRNFARLDEFHQTKFQRIRYPKDLPEGLAPSLPEDSLPPVLFGPANAFLPAEVGMWLEYLPRNTVLLLYYKRKGIWEETPFPLKMAAERQFSTRLISRFDLNRSGKTDYLVELQENVLTYRLIYELDEETGDATLTAATPDNVFIRDSKNPQCAKSGKPESLPPEIPAETGEAP